MPSAPFPLRSDLRTAALSDPAAAGSALGCTSAAIV